MALRGINLGGWLVAEKWMTRGLFEGVIGEGERSLGRELPKSEAEARVRTHRQNFIHESDFEWIAEHGFDFVRVPFGYWLFEEEEGYTSGEHHLQDVFSWAQRHGLQVLLDFHGLQGSQNGKDHSGEVKGAPGFYDGNNIERALGTLAHVVRAYGQQDGLLGIEVINEPLLPRRIGKLMNYYERAYQLVDIHTPKEVKVIVGDNFNPLKMQRELARYSFGSRLIHDTHLYQLFTKKEENMTLEEHIHKVTSDWRQLLQQLGGEVMVGEWTPALPSRAVQDREPMDALEIYHDAQINLFEEHAWAYCAWSYKVPDSLWWSYRDLPFIDKPRMN